MAGGRFELAKEPTAIGLVSLNSNSETHMTAICDARAKADWNYCTLGVAVSRNKKSRPLPTALDTIGFLKVCL